MTTLEKRALARPPLSYETVESFWDGSRSGTAEQCLKALCESHERLRAELEGSEILRADAEKELAAMKGKTIRYISIDPAREDSVSFAVAVSPANNSPARKDDGHEK